MGGDSWTMILYDKENEHQKQNPKEEKEGELAKPSHLTVNDEPMEGVTPLSEREINLALMQELFPGKGDEKCAAWVRTLADEEFETVKDLAGLSEEEWKSLSLPMAVRLRLAQAATAHHTTVPAADPVDVMMDVEPATGASSGVVTTAAPAPTETMEAVTQIDLIVLDISVSMKAKSTVDKLQTREDVSKILFSLLVDKIVALKMNHAVGMCAFGKGLTCIPITREYEKYQDELGRLDANEGGTKLYDAILEAAAMVLAYRDAHDLPEASLRIFVLTDGEDNRSFATPFQVAATLQKEGIVLDCIPLAGVAKPLRAIAAASGGLSISLRGVEQCVELFGDEAILHMASRAPPDTPPAEITSQAQFDALTGTSSSVASAPKTVVPTALKAKAMTRDEVKKVATTGGNGKDTQVIRRVLNEFKAIEDGKAPGWTAFVSSENCLYWKVIMEGPAGTPYQGGHYVLSVSFPKNFPFSPPNVRFITPIYHCNISQNGYLCLDILNNTWSPAHTMATVFNCITSLLRAPNPDDPLDVLRGQMLRSEPDRYMAEAHHSTIIHASTSLKDLTEKINAGTF